MTRIRSGNIILSYCLWFLFFWVITALIGIFLSQIIKNKKFEIVSSLGPQSIILLGFIYYAYFINQPIEKDLNENVKSNRLMVDYDMRLDDSIANFPNFIRIAYKKLEAYFGSEKSDSAGVRTIYFEYKTHDSDQLYSKLKVFNDTAQLIYFNKNINDSGYLNTKKRLNNWATDRIKSLLNEIKEAQSDD